MVGILPAEEGHRPQLPIFEDAADVLADELPEGVVEPVDDEPQAASSRVAAPRARPDTTPAWRRRGVLTEVLLEESKR